MIDFKYRRIEKICKDLESLSSRFICRINNIWIKEGDYKSIEQVNAAATPWKEFTSVNRIGGVNYHAWLRCDVIIPEELEGKTAAIKILTDTFRTGWAIWSSIRPQFLVYVNGLICQAADYNHKEIILTHSAQVGDIYQIDLPVFNGFVNEDGILAPESDLRIELVSIDKNIRSLYFDLYVPLMTALKLDPDDKARVDILNSLTDAINLLDMRKPYSQEFYQSVKAAADYMRTLFYGDICGHDEVLATYIGATHIDITWLWDLAQTRKKAVRSFSTVLNLMDQYSDFMFLSGQPQLYEYVKEDHPDIYARIKEKVKSGQWEIEGSMWVEAECTVSSGETLVRQIMFGKRFFQDEFGVDCRVFWAPDVFGFNGALPQILRKSGVDYFISLKNTWNRFNKPPYDTFMWRGIDSTEILSYFPTNIDVDELSHTFRTTYNGMMTPGEMIGTWKRYQQKEINNHLFGCYGYGDGGGGPTYEMIEFLRRMSKGIPGCPKVNSGRLIDFFVDLEKRVKDNPRLPVWEDELVLESHYGIYTAMGMTKKLHRLSELRTIDAEFLSCVAVPHGISYPQKMLNSVWKTILLNSNCDTLAGASIDEVYKDANAAYKQALNNTDRIMNDAFAAVNANIKLDRQAVIVWNTLSFVRNSLVLLKLPQGFTFTGLTTTDGLPVDCQLLDDGQVLFFAADIPSKGYKTYYFGDQKNDVTEEELHASESLLENRFFRIAIDECGNFSSIYDKRCKREIIRKGERGNVLQAFEDKPLMYDNYITEIYFKEKMWEISDVQNIEVIEQGILRAEVRITRRFLDSTIVQKIYVYRDIDRIDIETDIDWQEQQILLKAAFPVDIHARRATYDIQYGNIERSTHNNTPWDVAKFEVVAHKWADLSQSDYGVSIMTDCKYGYDIKNGIMRITLIKSGVAPNLNGDRGHHHFVYSLYPHQNGWLESGVVQKAYDLNVPVYACIEEPHDGVLPHRFSYVEASCDKVHIEVIKKAEDSDDIVLRLYEYGNTNQNVCLSFHAQLIKATECDMMENDLKPIPVKGNCIHFKIKPYEIKTFKILFDNK